MRATLVAVLVLSVGFAPVVGLAADSGGDGSAMFGVTPATSASSVGGDSGSAAKGTGGACQAKPATPVAPTVTVVGLAPALESLADELSTAAVLLGQLQVTPVAPKPPKAPKSAAAPKPAASARARQRADRAAMRTRVVTDTTVAVRPGSRFELHNFGGAVTIATWPKNAVRVQVEHRKADWAEFSQLNGVLRVASASSHGPAQAFEYRLTVPTWMPMALSGVYNDVTAVGLQGGINVETVRGDIVVRHSSGAIELRSVEGLVDLSDAKGMIKVSSVNDGVRLLKVAGNIQAEAVNGDIQLLNLSSKDVEATTVNGAVLFDGKMLDDGSYRFSTHNGDIALALTERSNATVTVSTYAGEFDAPFPLRLSRSQPGKRFTFSLGNGKAKVDVESFQGAIQLFTPGDREVLQRFRESWRESERERVKESKWIFKGDFNHEDEDDEDDEDPEDTLPVGHKKHK